MKRLLLILIAGLSLGLAVGCATSDSETSAVDNDDFELINDESYLYENEVVTDGTDLSFDDAVEAEAFSPLARSATFRMYRVASIKAPKHEGETLQAADVAIAGDSETSYAYVSYVMAGQERHGGIDVMELKRSFFPKLTSRLLTKKDDVNSIAYDADSLRLYMGLNVDPDEYGVERGAYFRTADLDADYKVMVSGDTILTSEMDLNSYAANDAAILSDGIVLVPVGAAGGGVEVIRVTPGGSGEAPTLERDTFISGIPDTRAVAATPSLSGVDFVVYRGPDVDGDAKIIKYSYDGSSFSSEGEIPITGVSYVETKAALEVHGNTAFLAASDGGVMGIDLENDEILFTISNPSGSLDADLVTANDVTVGMPNGGSSSLLFVANGEHGVRAYDLGFNVEESTDVGAALADFDDSSAYKGYISFGSGNSCNALLFRNGYLFAGAGLGGVDVIYFLDRSQASISYASPMR